MLRFSLFALSQRRTYHDRRSEGCLRMPFYALALQAQGTQPAAGAGELSTNTDIIHLVSQESYLGLGVLLILLLFSAISWGIVLYKIWVFRRAEV